MKGKHEYTEAEMENHKKIYHQVIADHSFEIFVAMFWKVLSVEEGFPDGALIRKYILQSAGAVPGSSRPRNCGKCQDGWVVDHYVLKGANHDKKVFSMRRCECKGGKPVDWEANRKALL